MEVLKSDICARHIFGTTKITDAHILFCTVKTSKYVVENNIWQFRHICTIRKSARKIENQIIYSPRTLATGEAGALLPQVMVLCLLRSELEMPPAC